MHAYMHVAMPPGVLSFGLDLCTSLAPAFDFQLAHCMVHAIDY